MEMVRAMSECACGNRDDGDAGDDGDADDDGKNKKRRRKREEKFRSLMHDLLLVQVAEDDLDGYRSLRKMDISLSDGGGSSVDNAGVGRIIMEGYRDTLAEETQKIRDQMSKVKIFHKDVGENKGGSGNTSTSSSSSSSNVVVESALFILLNDAIDPRAQLRRELTTLKVGTWTSSRPTPKKLENHALWPPEAKAIKEETESLVGYLLDATKEKMRLTIAPRVSGAGKTLLNRPRREEDLR